MFKTITRKTNEAKAVVGAAIATVKVLHEERKETRNKVAETYPMFTKKENRAYADELFANKVNSGLIDN